MVWEEGSWDDFRDEGEEGGEEVGDRQVQDEVVHPTHLQVANLICSSVFLEAKARETLLS